jgi:dTDP-4-amino-4,6-dideoxygalactose transaminase
MVFVDLYSDYLSIKDELDAKMQEVIKETAFIGSSNNRYVVEFENEFSSYLNIEHCVGCANGTDAIEIGLTAIGIKPGDEVIVPAISWISTAEAVVNIGAIPVFVDVLYADSNIDVSKVEEKITARTTAIIPVHLYGKPANMSGVIQISKKYNLKVFEDCAQAHGAEIEGKKVGTFGDGASFSFYPGKNLGAFGDAGAMVFNDKKYSDIARQILNHGQIEKHNHLRIGRNSRLDGLHAAILSVKLKYLDKKNDARILVAKNYGNHILNKSILPGSELNVKSVFHLYVIKVKNRSELIEKLEDCQIPYGIHYPIPLPEMKVFSCSERFNVANKLSKEILSIPIHPFLKEDEVKRIINVINDF